MQSIRLAVEKTERYKAELRDFLSSVQVISAYAAPIPDVSALEKRDADNGDYEPESHLYGQFATEKAIRALTSFYAPSGTNTFHPLLTPGLVQVPRAHMLEAERIIAALNSAKKAFSKAVAKITNKREKHEVIHSMFPMLMTKQVERSVPFIPASQSVSSIGFSFAKRNDSAVISFEQALLLLENFEQDLQRLYSYRGHELRRIRVKSPRIYANLGLDVTDTNKVKNKQLSGGIPVIASNEQDEPIKINPYSVKRKPTSGRRTIVEYALISAQFKLYAVLNETKPKEKR